jgi:hypothetical protein
MKPVHESLLPYVQTPAELYRLLDRMQAQALSSMGLRVLILLVCLGTGLVEPGAVGKAGLCLSALAGIACVTQLVDIAGRTWFMHALTLHELIRPRYESADVVMAEWLQAEDRGEA